MDYHQTHYGQTMNRGEDLRRILAKLNPEKHQKIRGAYCKAAEGFVSLRKLLDAANAQVDGIADEHQYARVAKEQLDRLRLGEVL